MRVAITLRGKCYDEKINDCNNKTEFIDYKKSINSVFDNLININKDYYFDFYLHGWVSNKKIKEEIIKDFKPKKYLLEKQINFYDSYSKIKNHQIIIKERYKHLHKSGQYTYDDINFQSFFQNLYSSTYSVSKSIELVEQDYDFIINMRYDALIVDKIFLNKIDKNYFYTNDVGIEHSHLFYGDFFYIATMENILFLKNLHNFIINSIFNNSEYKDWVKYILKKSKRTKGRYNHGIYSPQMIYVYFLYKNNITFKKIKPQIKISIKK